MDLSRFATLLESLVHHAMDTLLPTIASEHRASRLMLAAVMFVISATAVVAMRRVWAGGAKRLKEMAAALVAQFDRDPEHYLRDGWTREEWLRDRQPNEFSSDRIAGLITLAAVALVFFVTGVAFAASAMNATAHALQTLLGR